MTKSILYKEYWREFGKKYPKLLASGDDKDRPAQSGGSPQIANFKTGNTGVFVQVKLEYINSSMTVNSAELKFKSVMKGFKTLESIKTVIEDFIKLEIEFNEKSEKNCSISLKQIPTQVNSVNTEKQQAWIAALVNDFRNIYKMKDGEEACNDSFPQLPFILSEFGYREKVLAEINARKGQSEFRKGLIEAYEGQCAVTRCDCIEVLEAAHIEPYLVKGSNDICNGLLLRADIHTLFDRQLLWICPVTFKVILDDSLMQTEYRSFSNKQISLPSDPCKRPGVQYLKYRQEFNKYP